MAEKNITVLEIEGITVTKDTTSYNVTGGYGTQQAYFPKIESALEEVSERLFNSKLKKRSLEGLSDLPSLITMIKEHRLEMREKLRIDKL